MTRASRTLLFVAAGLGAIVVLALAVLAAVVATPLGTRAVAALAPRFVDGLSIENASGSFSSTVVLRGVHYRNGTIDALLDTVEIEPALGDVFDGRYVLERLAVRGGHVTLASSEPAAPPASTTPIPPPQILPLPESVGVRSVRIEQLTVQTADSSYVVDLAGSLEGAAIELAELALRGDGFALATAGEIRLAADTRATLAGTLSLDGADGAPPQRLRFATDAAVVTTASPWYARVEWTQLDWQGSPLGDLSSSSGTLLAYLGAAPIATELATRIEGGGLPTPATIEAAVSVSGFDAVEVERLHVDALGGSITAEGRIALAARSGAVTLTLQSLDPSVLHARLEGFVSGQFDANFATQPALRVSVNGTAAGMLRGKALDATVAASYDDGSLDIDSAYVEAGDGRLELSGSATRESVSLRFDAHLPELGTWYPPAAGSLDASGTVRGDARDPAVEVNLTAAGLEHEAVPVTVAQLSAVISGTLAAHEIEVDADAGRGSVRARVQQGWIDDALRGQLLATSLVLARAGTWTLEGPATYVAGANEIGVEHACFAGPQAARACVHADRNSAAIEARDLPAALVDPWLPNGVEASGASNLDAQIEWDGAPTGSFSFRQQSLVLSQAADPASAAGAAPPVRAEIADIEIAGTLTEADLQVHLTAALPDARGTIEGRVELAPPTSTGTLVADMNATVDDLAAIDALAANVEGLEGSLMARLTAGGTAAAPELRGEVRLAGLQASVPRLGVELANGRLNATAASLDTLQFDGELCSDGCVALDGKLDLAQSGWRLAADVEGRGFVLANRPDLRAIVAPDLEIAATSEQWLVTGELGIEEGIVVVDSVPRSAVRPASETVVHGRPPSAKPQKGSLPLAVKVDVALDDARFEGLGIVAALDGKLAVEQTREGRLLVNGTTTVTEGTFSTYGQTLKIERGQLIFTGTPDNPSLDLRASREVEGAIVGLDITGTAQEPRSEVFSDPALSDSEAFARLVTGRSLAGASAGADPQALERAAIGLGLRRALPTLDRIGTNLGLDELSVESGGDAQGALVAGKQLGEDIYLRYKHGLFEDFSGLELIYRITRHLRLRTQTGTQQSIDLVYETGNGPAGSIAESAITLDEGRSAGEVASPD